MKYYWVYFAAGNLSWLVWKNVPAYSDYLGVNSLADLIDKFGVGSFVPALYALFAVLAMTVIILSYPGRKIVSTAADQSVATQDDMKNLMYILRPLSVGAYCIVTIMITYFI